MIIIIIIYSNFLSKKFNGGGYKPLIQVRGSRSHQSKIQMEDRKDEDTCKKGKMAEKKLTQIFFYKLRQANPYNIYLFYPFYICALFEKLSHSLFCCFCCLCSLTKKSVLIRFLNFFRFRFNRLLWSPQVYIVKIKRRPIKT